MSQATQALMGIDLGTSSVKTVVIAADGRVLALASREYNIDTPQPGWAEQDPQMWVAATVQTMQAALAQSGLPPAQVQGIGLSGQMHGLVCLDRDGGVMRPAIIWADQRSVAQVERIQRTLGAERLGEYTGNPVAAGFLLPSWLWLVENEPKTVRSTAHLLSSKDAVRYYLTGALGTDPSDACATALFDTAQRRWSRPMLDAFQIDPALLPALHASTEVAGGLLDVTAAQTGLLTGTPVVFGGGDQPVQALGNGLIDPGWLSCTIGTGGQLFAPLQTPAYDPELRVHSFCHILPDRWYLMAATLAAGLSLKWLRNQLFPGFSYTQLADMAREVEDTEGLIFLPHLAGERTPYMDPQSRGCFWGLTLRHTRAHMVRAVMEGVVFGLRQGLDIIEAIGAPVERMVASGGATNHPLWLQLQADIFNQPIYRTQTSEAAAQGAALLAGIGAGVYADAAEACRQAVRWSDEVVYPQAERRVALERQYERFQKLYPALKTIG